MVGSSKIRRLDGRRRPRANSKRARSPPDKRLIGVRCCSGKKRKSFIYPMTCFCMSPTITLSPPPPVSASFRVVSGSSPSRFWSRTNGWRLVPSLIVPSSASNCPMINLSRVVLPLPLGPIMPMRSPRAIRVEKLSMIIRSPKALLTCSNLATNLPEVCPSVTLILALPMDCFSLRFVSRKFPSSLSRRTLRLRRPDTPWTTQCCSRSILRDNL